MREGRVMSGKAHLMSRGYMQRERRKAGCRNEYCCGIVNIYRYRGGS